MTAPAIQSPPCPTCGSEMWDETKSKFYKPGKPIWKCKNTGCKGVIWAPKTGAGPTPQPQLEVARPAPAAAAVPPVTKFARLAGLLELHDLCLAHSIKQTATMEQSVVADTADAISSRAATTFIQAVKNGLAG